MDMAPILIPVVLAAACGGRAQLTVARLAAALGNSGGLLLAALTAAFVSSLAMGFAGAWLAGLVGQTAGIWLVVLGIALAAAELAVPVRLAAPREPTRSLGAIALALTLRQVFDAPRWLAFALGAALASPEAAALAAAVGSGLALLIGWNWPDWPERRHGWRILRLVMAGLLAAGLIGLFISGCAS
ncbi:hypothetical protein [Altererythrobacter sp. Z27]|uniref:hypothetical protein n=1 Tax=Altererythrobacter sp. Z27 TaxID=3461147 RepID=UPI00404457C3